MWIFAVACAGSPELVVPGTWQVVGGTSARDLWAWDGSSLQHGRGDGWAAVDLGRGAEIEAVGFVVGGEGELWVYGVYTATWGGWLVEAHADGTVVDHGADLPAFDRVEEGYVAYPLGGGGPEGLFFGFPEGDHVASNADPVRWLRWDGAALAPMAAPDPPVWRIYAATGPETFYYASGDSGAVVAWDAGVATPLSVQPGVVLDAVAPAPDDVWFGAGITGVHGDGAAWAGWTAIDWPAEVAPVGLVADTRGASLVGFADRLLRLLPLDADGRVIGEAMVAQTDATTPMRGARLADGGLVLTGTMTGTTTTLYVVSP